ncbi:MAG: hypothetical protein ACI9LT_003598, partial [Pseudoalteromonas distincta]
MRPRQPAPRPLATFSLPGTLMPAQLQTMADAIRVLSMDAVHRAKSGH